MTWLSRLFGQRRTAPPPPRDMRNMNEDWKAGDLARCVAHYFVPGTPEDPHFGDILRVSEVYQGSILGRHALAYGLRFHGKSSPHGWICTAFIKIKPETTADEVEDGIIAKIKRAARKGAGVDA
ncbi:hypothetical protein [Sphingopyxis flava]|uniref:Uncharacterized protein n=1 Tax=Sphingopyxis flava TaxID=1507287 RepID=A0A1T4ZWV7_9SPHN|nr:hypothetical protein [Sphingopyxis flava]SKB26969.1 hypothetical protein SAMN06295937_1001258 [Sphingopyxis flava]